MIKTIFMQTEEKFTLSKNLFDAFAKDKQIMMRCGDINIEVEKKKILVAMAVGNIHSISGSVYEDMPEVVYVDGLFTKKD